MDGIAIPTERVALLDANITRENIWAPLWRTLYQYHKKIDVKWIIHDIERIGLVFYKSTNCEWTSTCQFTNKPATANYVMLRGIMHGETFLLI